MEFPPFLIFVIIMVVIWALSAAGSMITKVQEAERRRKFREMMERQQSQPQRQQQQSRRQPPRLAQPQIQPQLNPEFAVRHPEMMERPTWPMPVQSAPPPPPLPVRRQSASPGRTPQQQLRQPRAPRVAILRRAPAAIAPPPPIPVLEADDAPRAPLRATAAATKPVQQSTAPHSADAPAISRWLRPGTLRQQFILTEIFQPPLAMRQDRLGGA